MNDDLIIASEPLPRIASATPLDGRKVALVFQDGSAKTVDLAPALASRRVYIPLRENDELFRQLRVSDYGDAIEWKGGLDFSALWLSKLPDIAFDNASFRNAMAKLEMSLDGMANMLQISRRLVASYRKDKPIPRHVAFATAYLVEHHQSTVNR